jgi:hypothetical protein
VVNKTIILVLGLSLYLFASEPISNLALLDSLLEEELNLVFQGANADTSGVQLEFGAVKGEKRGYIRAILIEYLTKKNVPVNRSEASLKLIIEQFNPMFVYTQVKGNLLGISDTYERKLNLKLKGWLQKTSGEVIHFFEKNKFYSDMVREKQFSKLEVGPYSFQKGDIIETTIWGKAIEPVLVILSVTTVVYLFFTMRS